MAKAKDFNLFDQDNKKHSLSESKGRWVVVYFYPKDDTQGCTLEGIDFTNHRKEFEKLNAIVYGISPDTVDSHQKFCTKHKLGITLLADPEKKTITDYDVWKKKSMYGREYMGVERSTFLISPKQEIVWEWRKVSVTGHVKEVLEKIKELKG